MYGRSEERIYPGIVKFGLDTGHFSLLLILGAEDVEFGLV